MAGVIQGRIAVVQKGSLFFFPLSYRHCEEGANSNKITFASRQTEGEEGKSGKGPKFF